MPSYLRWKITGATYFFTVVTYRRRCLFADARNRRFLGASFREARESLPFEIDAAVLLPDHLHVLMRPAECVDYSALWRLIKTLFTRRLLSDRDGASRCTLPVAENRASRCILKDGRRRGEASVWQRRFFEHTIRDQEDWGRHVDYIHWNPVKHGLVARPQDWKWSSVHRYIREGLQVPDAEYMRNIEVPAAGE